MRVPERVYDLWRRLAGCCTIDDPRPIAEEAPYTYFLPSENELLALAPGDLAQLIFRSHPPAREWDAERMWVTVTAAGAEVLHGTLANDPCDMPQLRYGAAISFKRSQVINVDWSSDRITSPPPAPKRREYWERCMVDSCVVRGDCPVDYLYREAPDLDDSEDKYPDSGWRVRGTDEGIADDERQGRAPQYIALGAVLNIDDSWLHLIDEPVSSAFIRDRDEFVPCSRSAEI